MPGDTVIGRGRPRGRRARPSCPVAAHIVAALVLLATAFTFLSGSASAQTCSITNGTINFGTYTGALSNAGTTTFTVTCTAGLAYTVKMNAGSNSGSTSGNGVYNWELAQTILVGPFLHYNVYRDTARSMLWGSISGTDTLSGTGTGTAQTITVYPQIPAYSAVVPGTYSDYITTSVQSVAGTAYGMLSVSVTVPASCAVSVSLLAFGTYTGAQSDTTATVSALCTNTTTYYVGVDYGLHSGGTYDWEMIGPGSNLLSYKLYRDSARTQLWGNTQNSDTPSGTGTGSTQAITLYGRLTASQGVNPGSYADTVTLTVHY